MMGDFIESRKNLERWHNEKHTEKEHEDCPHCKLERYKRRDKRYARLAALRLTVNANLTTQIASYEEALTASTETKIAYWGSDELPVMDWRVMKEFMKVIKKRGQGYALPSA